MSLNDIQIRIEPHPQQSGQGKRADRPVAGLLGSSVMHLVGVLLLVFGLPWLFDASPQITPPVPVNLVQLADKTASPAAPELAQVPQTLATESANATPAQPVPVPQTPPPLTAERKAPDEKAAPEILTAAKSARQQEIAKPVKGPQLDTVPAAHLKREPQPQNDLSAQLERLAQLRQPPSPLPPQPKQLEGPGFSNVTASSAEAARGASATYSVKDFIRAQVERRWNVDRNRLEVGDWAVDIHIMLDANGTVTLAEVVDTPRFHSDTAYRDFALSARNAVLLSSPLVLPADEYDIAKDIVVDFDSKQVFQ